MNTTLARTEKTTSEEYVAPKPWHVWLATWLGGVFDGMDSSIFAIVLYPAMSELLQTTSHAIVGVYASYIIALFMVGWALGAMIFGVLADYIGRARTLTLTILVYALCTGLCATAHSWWEMGLYRFLVGAGIGGEMCIGAVMLSECWPAKSRRYAVTALATSLGVGYILTATLNLALGHLGWRYLFVAGILPAFLTVYIRAKLKEPHHFVKSQAAKEEARAKAAHERTEHEEGLLKPTWHALAQAENVRKTVIVAALTSCALIAWWAVLSWIPAWINQLTASLAVEQRSSAMYCKDFGMILSGIVGGLLIKRFGYSKCMAATFALAFAATVGMFMTIKDFSPALFPFILCVGFFAHVPFVLLWAYIPELYETRIRSTAFGVTYNVGRFLAALAALGSG
ncbi:MAG TPA: MFS transporter, partial [Candidatus Obscuribacterales bacterium]